MQDPENNFSPLLIDQQIEHPSAFLPRGEARLIQDLQAMYDQEKSASIDQVWTRLARQRTAASQQPKMHLLQEQRRHSERRSTIKRTDVASAQRKRFPRLLGLITAALVTTVLVSSMAFVFSVLRSKTPAPGGHSSAPTAKTSTAAATPTLPSACRDFLDQADETLCSQHAETTLNITKTFRTTGYGAWTVTFLRAYADSVRVMLLYTVKNAPDPDAISFTGLTIQGGMTLGGGAEHAACSDLPTPMGCELVEFKTETIPTSTTALHIQAIVDGFTGVPTPLHFTIPFHTAQKIVLVNQTITSNGVSLTLDHLVLTESTANIYLKVSQPQKTTLAVRSMTVNGQQMTNLSSGGVGSAGASWILDQALLDRPGSWTIEMESLPTPLNPGGVCATWTFHFTVPD